MLDAPQDVLMQKGVVCNTHIPLCSRFISSYATYGMNSVNVTFIPSAVCSSYCRCREKKFVKVVLVLKLAKAIDLIFTSINEEKVIWYQLQLGK